MERTLDVTEGNDRRNGGVDYLRSFISGDRPHPKHSQVFGVRIVAAERGLVHMIWEPPELLLNPAGSIHGGFIAGVLDMAAGLAAASDRDLFAHHITLEIQIDFLSPAQCGMHYNVVGRAVRTGKASSLADATITGSTTTVARSRGTFLPNRRW